MKYLMIISILVMGIVNLAIAREDLSNEPGYVDFSTLEQEYGEAKVLINLNKTMLSFMSLLSDSDSDTKELLSNLTAINVHVYNIEGNDQPALELIAQTAKKISADNWMPVVSVKEDDKRIKIFSKLTDNVMDGLVVMAINEERAGREAVFINIIGELDPAQIRKVTRSLNIDLE